MDSLRTWLHESGVEWTREKEREFLVNNERRRISVSEWIDLYLKPEMMTPSSSSYEEVTVLLKLGGKGGQPVRFLDTLSMAFKRYNVEDRAPQIMYERRPIQDATKDVCVRVVGSLNSGEVETLKRIREGNERLREKLREMEAYERYTYSSKREELRKEVLLTYSLNRERLLTEEGKMSVEEMERHAYVNEKELEEEWKRKRSSEWIMEKGEKTKYCEVRKEFGRMKGEIKRGLIRYIVNYLKDPFRSLSPSTLPPPPPPTPPSSSSPPPFVFSAKKQPPTSTSTALPRALRKRQLPTPTESVLKRYGVKMKVASALPPAENKYALMRRMLKRYVMDAALQQDMGKMFTGMSMIYLAMNGSVFTKTKVEDIMWMLYHQGEEKEGAPRFEYHEWEYSKNEQKKAGEGDVMNVERKMYLESRRLRQEFYRAMRNRYPETVYPNLNEIQGTEEIRSKRNRMSSISSSSSSSSGLRVENSIGERIMEQVRFVRDRVPVQQGLGDVQLWPGGGDERLLTNIMNVLSERIRAVEYERMRGRVHDFLERGVRVGRITLQEMRELFGEDFERVYGVLREHELDGWREAIIENREVNVPVYMTVVEQEKEEEEEEPIPVDELLVETWLMAANTMDQMIMAYGTTQAAMKQEWANDLREIVGGLRTIWDRMFGGEGDGEEPVAREEVVNLRERLVRFTETVGVIQGVQANRLWMNVRDGLQTYIQQWYAERRRGDLSHTREELEEVIRMFFERHRQVVRTFEEFMYILEHSGEDEATREWFREIQRFLNPVQQQQQEQEEAPVPTTIVNENAILGIHYLFAEVHPKLWGELEQSFKRSEVDAYVRGLTYLAEYYRELRVNVDFRYLITHRHVLMFRDVVNFVIQTFGLGVTTGVLRVVDWLVRTDRVSSLAFTPSTVFAGVLPEDKAEGLPLISDSMLGWMGRNLLPEMDLYNLTTVIGGIVTASLLRDTVLYILGRIASTSAWLDSVRDMVFQYHPRKTNEEQEYRKALYELFYGEGNREFQVGGDMNEYITWARHMFDYLIQRRAEVVRVLGGGVEFEVWDWYHVHLMLYAAAPGGARDLRQMWLRLFANVFGIPMELMTEDLDAMLRMRNMVRLENNQVVQIQMEDLSRRMLHELDAKVDSSETTSEFMSFVYDVMDQFGNNGGGGGGAVSVLGNTEWDPMQLLQLILGMTGALHMLPIMQEYMRAQQGNVMMLGSPSSASQSLTVFEHSHPQFHKLLEMFMQVDEFTKLPAAKGIAQIMSMKLATMITGMLQVTLLRWSIEMTSTLAANALIPIGRDREGRMNEEDVLRNGSLQRRLTMFILIVYAIWKW